MSAALVWVHPDGTGEQAPDDEAPGEGDEAGDVEETPGDGDGEGDGEGDDAGGRDRLQLGIDHQPLPR